MNLLPPTPAPTPESKLPASKPPTPNSTTAHRVPVISIPDQNPQPENYWRSILVALLAGTVFALVTFYYRGAIFDTAGKVFQKTPSAVVEEKSPATPPVIGDQELRLNLKAPETVRRGETFDATLSLENLSSTEFSVELTPQHQGVFETRTLPTPVKIAPGAQHHLNLGVLAKEMGSFTLGYEVKIGTQILNASKTVTVLEPEFSVWLDLGDAPSFKTRGRMLYVAVHWANTSPQQLQNGELMISGAHLTPRTIRMRRVILPGQRGSFRAWFRTDLPVGTSVSPAELEMRATVNYAVATRFELTDRELTVSATPSALHLKAFSRIHDSQGKPIASGPLPLIPGEPSRLWVNLALNRESRTTGPVSVLGQLADRVKFTGRTWVNNQDQLILDPTAKTFTWKTTGPLPRARRMLVPIVGFEIEITPDASDAGAFPRLLNSLEANGISFGSVAADQRFDKYAEDLGLVRK